MVLTYRTLGAAVVALGVTLGCRLETGEPLPIAMCIFVGLVCGAIAEMLGR